MEGSGGKGVVVGGDHHHQYHPKYYKKGLWTEEEDKILMDYIMVHGKGKWNRVAKVTGLKRCGKSCRLRWMNYLSPNVKRGDFSEQEEDLIIRLHKLLGNRWSLIAGRVPGRTDNQVKNHWNTHLSKKLGIKMGMMINKRKAGSIVVSSSKGGDHDDNSARDIKKLKLIMTTDQDQDQEEEEDSNDDTHKLQTFESNIAAGGNSTSTAAGYDQFSNNIHPSNYDGQEPVLTVAAAATAAGGGEMDDQCNFFLSSFWFFNNNNEGDQLYHCLGTAASDAPKLLEIPDGYPLDMVWHGCP